ncbi:MAG: substrate-binding domain-containing protein [Desulfuromonadaceae bacterium]|nr:substrate-binding domain-containing protein [Desulfuromonadaceae bacterium]
MALSIGHSATFLLTTGSPMKTTGLVLISILFLLLSGCDTADYPEPTQSDRQEMLIYCGMTMIKPVLELAAEFEQQENCTVKLTYGGSNHLKHSIEINQIGDLFLPGDDSFIRELQQSGIVTETQSIGYNQAALFVQYGNPKNISPELSNLTDRQLHTVIGSDKSGSIGRETRRILDQAGLYQDVVDNALYLTTDSKGLVKAIKTKEADIVINWQAVLHLDDNTKYMTLLPIAEQYIEKQPLILGLLRYSPQPELARKFMALAASKTGQRTFKRYGFRD